MDLTWSDSEEALRAEARGWLDQSLRAWRDECGGEPASGDTRDGFAQHLQWERRLFADRWAAVSWPTEHGGRGASLWEWLIFEEEYYRAGGPPRVTQNGIFLLAPSIFEFGTPEQQTGILARMAGAEDLWCQGWSEPNAGSDLASVTSKARRVDGGWVLDGQKTWTTRGVFCTHLFGLFRTDPDSARHKGLTYLLLPLDTPGVTVRGFGRLDGDEGFAEVFFDDAFLADDAVPGGVVLGEPEGGWAVAMATAGSERGLTLRSPGRFVVTAERLVVMAAEHGDRTLRRRSATAWMHADAYHQHTLATVTKLASGARPGAEASLTKLWWSELDIELHQLALDLLGPEAEAEGPWSKAWQFSLSGPIYAGTNEIQRNIAAERVLGLPPMRFSLSDDQIAFRDAVRELLAKECPPSVVRAAWEAPEGELDRGVWDSLDAMGVLTLLVPEVDGGLGLDETYLVPILEECGRVALPHPIVETAMVAAPLLGAGAGMVASDLGGPLVPCAADADQLLLRGGHTLAMVERDAVEITAVATVDGARRAGRVSHDSTSEPLTDDLGVIELALDHGALGTAAMLVGVGQAMLDLTVGYVSERHQFGKPIGSFQAVKHHLADAALALELTRPAVWRAAWSVAHDEATRARDVSMAKAMASDTADLVSRHALQCHGAIGYTVEADLHLYLKRTWALARSWGDSAHHTDRVADALGA